MGKSTTKETEKSSFVRSLIQNWSGNSKNMYNHNLDYLINELFHHLVTGDSNCYETEDLFKQTGLTFNNSLFYVTSFKLYNSKLKSVDLAEAQRLHCISDKIYAEIANRSTDPVWFYKISYHSTLIITNTNESSSYYSEFIKTIKKWILLEYSLDSAWGISLPCSTADDLFLAAEQAVISTKTAEKGNILTYSNICPNENTSGYFPQSLENLLIMSIKNNNPELIDCVIQIIYDENFIVHPISTENLGTLNAKICNSLYHFNSQIITQHNIIITLNQCIATSPSNSINYFSQLKETCHIISAKINEKKSTQKNILITQITQYLIDNFSNSGLCLSCVADHFNISEGYLSSIFKDNTSMKFTDYIENLRIDAACKLLSDKKISINDISDKVGYNSVYSFRRAFKRCKDIGPSEYRSQNITCQ